MLQPVYRDEGDDFKDKAAVGAGALTIEDARFIAANPRLNFGHGTGLGTDPNNSLLFEGGPTQRGRYRRF